MTAKMFPFTAALALVVLASCRNNEAQTAAPNRDPAPISEGPGSQTAPPTNQEPPLASDQSRDPANARLGELQASCPMLVAGARVEVVDTQQGVALVFTTDEGDAVNLRKRVEHLAQMYEMRGADRQMMWRDARRMHTAPDRGPGMGRMGGLGPMPQANTQVIPLDDGARLELTPTDPSQLSALRAHVRRHQRRMQSQECWMWRDPQPSR